MRFLGLGTGVLGYLRLVACDPIHAFKVTLRQVIASISYLNDGRYKYSNYINVDECLHERKRSNTLKFQNFEA